MQFLSTESCSSSLMDKPVVKSPLMKELTRTNVSTIKVVYQFSCHSTDIIPLNRRICTLVYKHKRLYPYVHSFNCLLWELESFIKRIDVHFTPRLPFGFIGIQCDPVPNEVRAGGKGPPREGGLEDNWSTAMLTRPLRRGGGTQT